MLDIDRLDRDVLDMDRLDRNVLDMHLNILPDCPKLTGAAALALQLWGKTMITSPPTIAVSNENVITPFIICMFNCMILGRHAFNDHVNYWLVTIPSYL